MLQDIEGQDNLTALHKKLQETTNDSMKVVYLNQIALANINLTQTDSAIAYANRALEIAQEISSPSGQANSYYVLGKAYKAEKRFADALDNYLKSIDQSKITKNQKFIADVYVELGFLYQDWSVFDKSIDNFQEAYQIRKQIKDFEGEINCLNYIALSYYRSNDLESALNTYQLQLDLANKNDDKNKAVSALRNIANIYSRFQDFETALRYNLQILDIKKEQGDSLGIATYYNNVGSIYKRLDQNNQALESFKQALKINRELGKDEIDNIVILRNIGVIYQSMRDYRNALKYFKEALGILELRKDVKEVARTCNYITTIYYGLQDFDNAIQYTNRAIDLAKEANDKETLAKSYKRMSDIYQKQRNNKKALEYFQKYAAVKDDIIMEERIKQEQLASQQMEVEKEEQKLKQRLLEEEMKGLEKEKQRIEAEKQIKDLALAQKEKDLELRNKALEVAKLKQEELEKARQLQQLKIDQARLADEARQREIQLLERDRELERKKRQLQEKEKQDYKKQVEQLQLNQKVKDLEIENARRDRLFFISSVALFAILLGVAFIAYYQKNKSNKKLASINKEIKEKNEQIEIQLVQIEDQRQELEKAYKDIKLISLIGQKITASIDIESVTQTVYEYVGSLMKTNAVGLGIYNADAQMLEFKGAIENGNKMPYHYDLLSEDNSLSVWCFNRRRQVVIGDFAEDYSQYVNFRPEMRTKENIKSALYLPLATEKRPIGVITVQSPEQDAYTSKDITILQTLASYISIALDNAQAYDIIKDKNKHITDSIRYAQTIQKAILPSKVKMDEVLDDHFVLYYPKDIVSGDFFWFTHIPADRLPSHVPAEQRRDKTYVAVVDCTGHGVPGAFMSMIGTTLLNDIVMRSEVYEPAEILEFLHSSVVNELRQRESANDDGMDVCMCLIEQIDDENVQVTYTGAKRPLYYVEYCTSTIKELKGTNKGIGGIVKKFRPFTNQVITVPKGSMVYLSSDGLQDQNNRDNRKIGSIRLKHVLQENYNTEMQAQKEALASLLYKHQDGMPQRDDITVVGIKV
ncbi:MAG: tetratricopeptide repeat protein [Flammeovirgaceae bacterium]